MFHHDAEPIEFESDCEAVRVPSGDTVTLPTGSFGYITQALGGSFTVFVDGQLYRIAGEQGAAFGQSPLPPPELPDPTNFEDYKACVWSQLNTCYDPEIPVSVLALGLIYECDIQESEGQRDVAIKMTLTAPGCGMGDIIVDEVKSKVLLVPTTRKAQVELVFDPPWSREMMSEEARLQTGMMW